jgi:DNA-binding PadR family transcriptional regulator
MSIKFTILGFLSWKPLTGYDLKKLIADSPILPWSGNNNQIYTTLVDLHKSGLVTQEIENQASGPSRKIYTITAAGRAELRAWICSTPELPILKNTFHAQLAWADLLDAAELDDLLASYEEEVSVQLLMLREQHQRHQAAPDRSPRERLLWDRIMDNRIMFYAAELDWVRQLREELQ